MKNIMAIVIAAFVLVGCGAPPSQADLQRAAAIVWNSYDLPTSETPALDMRTASSCTDQYGNIGLELPSGQCVLGWTDDGGCHFLVYRSLADSSLAHEMHHWAIYVRRGGGSASMDPNHEDPTWGWEVDRAVGLLREAGL